MTETYANLNDVWTPVLVIQSDTPQKYGSTIADGSTRYAVEPLKQEQTDGKYIYWFVVRSKETLVLPEAAQQQIANLQVATDTQPIDTSTLEGTQKAKIRELSNACHAAIYGGVDAATSKGTERFSLTDNDQINLSNLMEQVKGGAAQVPYHSDGQLCRMFAAAEMTAVYQAAVQYIAYNTTLCNHLLTWVRRCTTVADVSAITYTSVLPDDLQQNLNTILGGAKS